MLAHLITIGYFDATAPAPLSYGWDDPGPVSDIIYRAMRRIGVINARQTLTDTQARQALAVFKTLIRTLPNSWTTVTATDGYTAGEDQRVYLDTTVQIYKPAYIDACGKGFSDYADGRRAPRDGAKLQFIDRATGTGESYVYRADFAEWIAISSLTMASESPFNADLDEALSAALAMLLAEEYGVEPTLTTQRMAMSFLNVQRWRTSGSTVAALEFY